MTWTIIILLVIIAVVAYLLWNNQQREVVNHRQTKDLPLSIEHVQPGGLVHLSRVGRNMTDMDVSIVARHTYREGNFQWHELEGESSDGKVWIDVEHDDELEVAVSLQKLRLDEIGVTKDALWQMDEDEEGRLDFDGRSFYYDDSGDAEFLRNGDPDNAERFHYWDFESEDGKHYLGVEAWDNHEFQAHYVQPLSLSQIEVFSLGETDNNA